MKVPAGFEFEFSKTKKSYRVEFLKSVRLFKFYCLSTVIDKKLLDRSLYKKSKMKFYDFIISEFIQTNKKYFRKSTIHFDKMIDPLIHKSFNSWIRRLLKDDCGKNVINIKHDRSQSNNLIQLADMIAGTLFHKFEYRESKYYDLIKLRQKVLIK